MVGANPRPPALTNRPGSLLAFLIHRLTGETGSAGCNCDRRRRAMDRWGFGGCWKRRHLIISWIAEEARARGHEVDSARVASLFYAALSELRQRRTAASDSRAT